MRPYYFVPSQFTQCRELGNTYYHGIEKNQTSNNIFEPLKKKSFGAQMKTTATKTAAKPFSTKSTLQFLAA